jgi:hypothetical protein
LLDHAAINPDLYAAIGDVTATKLGKRFAQVAGHDCQGLRLMRVTEDSGGWV